MTRFYPLLFVLLWSTGFIGAKYGLPYACLLYTSKMARIDERSRPHSGAG